MHRRDILGLAAMLPLICTVGPGEAEAALKVDGILVEKSKRSMSLLSGRSLVKKYRINLGFTPVGPKRFQGDGRTPEGTYIITHKNPQSQFFRSLGVSYPSRADAAFARSKGRSPGGDIFIHGTGRGPGRAVGDWTRGCIAVTDQEMADIYDAISPGTRITIRP